MKPVSYPLKAYLDAARAGDAPLTFADCFTFTFVTGDAFHLTNYDQSITWNGTTFVANSALIDGLKYKTAVGLEVDKQQITLAAYPTTEMNGAPLMRAIAGGAFDGARVQRWRVFLSNQSDRRRRRGAPVSGPRLDGRQRRADASQDHRRQRPRRCLSTTCRTTCSRRRAATSSTTPAAR